MSQDDGSKRVKHDLKVGDVLYYTLDACGVDKGCLCDRSLVPGACCYYTFFRVTRVTDDPELPYRCVSLSGIEGPEETVIPVPDANTSLTRRKLMPGEITSEFEDLPVSSSLVADGISMTPLKKWDPEETLYIYMDQEPSEDAFDEFLDSDANEEEEGDDDEDDDDISSDAMDGWEEAWDKEEEEEEEGDEGDEEIKEVEEEEEGDKESQEPDPTEGDDEMETVSTSPQADFEPPSQQ